MIKRFKFTNALLKGLPASDANSASSELEFSGNTAHILWVIYIPIFTS
jgi:hypothetical protein